MSARATAQNHAIADMDTLREAPSRAAADALDTLTRRQSVMSGIRLLSGRRIFGVAVAGVTAAGGFGRPKTTARDASIQCGGVNVLSGDVVLGDGEGIVVVPAALVAATAAIVAQHANRIERLTRSAEELGSLSEAMARHWHTSTATGFSSALRGHASRCASDSPT